MYRRWKVVLYLGVLKLRLKGLEDVPDVIYHKGAWGKEPSISLIGTSAVDVAKMAVCIAKLYNNIEGYNVIFTPPSEKEELKNLKYPVYFVKWQKAYLKSFKKCSNKDGNTMVVLNKFPFTKGHLLVVPVKHYTHFE